MENKKLPIINTLLFVWLRNVKGIRYSFYDVIVATVTRWVCILVSITMNMKVTTRELTGAMS